MFWENLESICSAHGITPTALAPLIGVSTGTVSGWRHGASPRLDALEKVAAYFGITVSDLLAAPSTASPVDLSRFAPPLTADEQALLDAYRTDPALRAAIDAMLVAAGHGKKAPDAESFA